jgi:hypothetical protein
MTLYYAGFSSLGAIMRAGVAKEFHDAREEVNQSGKKAPVT